MANCVVLKGLWVRFDAAKKLRRKGCKKPPGKKVLNEVSGSLTHDFNNILTGIINLADLMRPDYADQRDDGKRFKYRFVMGKCQAC